MMRASGLIMLAGLSSCAAFAPNEVAQPSKLTVADAMGDIAEGFLKMRATLDQNPNFKLGLWPCKVTVNLNVTASADQGGKLVLDTSIKPPVKIVDASITGHAEQTNNSSATRGNTIDVELYSAACLPKDTLGADKPDKIGVAADGMGHSLGQSPLRQPFPNPPR